MEAENAVIKVIQSRRSVRSFSDDPVPEEILNAVLEAGRWAPSGLNNQPWRFFIVEKDALKSELARQTRYGAIISGAPTLVAVFLDRTASYDWVKDIQACGACIQNMLLAIHGLGWGGVWLGEILKNADAVRDLLGLSEDLVLMAVLALGRPKSQGESSQRRPVAELVLGRE